MVKIPLWRGAVVLGGNSVADVCRGPLSAICRIYSVVIGRPNSEMENAIFKGQQCRAAIPEKPIRFPWQPGCNTRQLRLAPCMFGEMRRRNRGKLSIHATG